MIILAKISFFNSLNTASLPYLQTRYATNIGALSGEYDQSSYRMPTLDPKATYRTVFPFDLVLFKISNCFN